MILETNKPIWHIRVVAAIIFILLISNFSNIAICLTVLFIFIFSCLIEKISGKNNYYAYATKNTGLELFFVFFLLLILTIFFKTLSGFILILSLLFCLSVLVIQDSLSCFIDGFLDKVMNNNFYDKEFSGAVRFIPLIISFMLFCVSFEWQTLRFIENSSWNSISWKELLMLLTKFSNYNDKFAFDSGITLSVTAAKDVSFRLLSEQFDAINSIKKSLQIAWWFSFILGLIYPIIYSKIFKA